MKIYIPQREGALLVFPVLLDDLVQLSRAMNACFDWYLDNSLRMPNGSWQHHTEEIFRLYNYLDVMNSKCLWIVAASIDTKILMNTITTVNEELIGNMNLRDGFETDEQLQLLREFKVFISGIQNNVYHILEHLETSLECKWWRAP
jgi:hypothetical protein